MSATILDIVAVAICLFLTLVIYALHYHTPCPASLSQGYILRNQVTHARLLPIASRHSFTYPTISFLLSLDALEKNQLDIGHGWLFGYGGLWGRLTGLRSDPYLVSDSGGSCIRDKLQRLLSERLHKDVGPLLKDAWMMTMPSILGWEGINPLTVYFCYDVNDHFWFTVLEIHNTFGESHVHVLEVGQEEDTRPARGYDHQWTFRREFHVSPFNDRSGFYTVSIKRPSHPPFAPLLSSIGLERPLPTVRVHLYTASSECTDSLGPLKLTALLRPTLAIPLSCRSLLLELLKAPLALFLSFPRILYHAWILHYIRRLDVFIRPEPYPASSDTAAVNFNLRGVSLPANGVKWQGEGVLEKHARTVVEDFLKRRVEETGISVTLIPGDPSVERKEFSPSKPSKDPRAQSHLTISYLAPRFFTILYLSPSASHALLLGHKSEMIFFPSSPELFVFMFTPGKAASYNLISPTQWLRTQRLPSALTSSTWTIPANHMLENSCNELTTFVVVMLLLVLEKLQALLFRMAHARTVSGEEPWMQWERAAALTEGRQTHALSPMWGSVRRET